MKSFIKRAFVIVCCFALLASSTVSAITPSYAPYEGYEYNSYDESVAAPIGYLQSNTISGKDLSFPIDIKSFTDICVDAHNPDYMSTYILDGKAGIVYKCDASLNVKTIFRTFTDKNGKAVSLKGASLIASDFADSFFYVYKGSTVYVISDMSVVVSSFNISNLTSLVSLPVLKSDDSFATNLMALTSDNKSGVTLFDANGKKLGFYKLGTSVNNLNVNFDGSDATLLVSDASKKTLTTYSVVTDFDDDNNSYVTGFESSDEYKVSLNISSASSVASDSLDETYYLTMNNSIACYNNVDEEFKYITSAMLPHTVKKDLKYSKVYVSPNDGCLYAFSKTSAVIDVYNSAGGYVKDIDHLKISLNTPNDILYKNGYVYILDSGNSRVLKLDKDLTSVLDIKASFYSDKKGYLSFYGAQGFTVDAKENIYIADTENERVLLADSKGYVKHIITRPNEQLADTKSPFRATKVLLDRKNLLYIICDTINLGAFQYNLDGEFQSFFGSNTVVQTAQVILNYIRKRFMTKAQIKALEQSTPISITNFDIDDEGFVYTVTSTDQDKKNDDFTGMIRKLNFQGDDIFSLSGNSKGFGDLEWDRQDTVKNTSFIDVDVDDEGYINMIDFARGKIFQYSNDGDLITVFGRSSNQYGTFADPVAIESIDNKILVLDRVNNNIVVFKPTAYALALRKAYLLLDSSDADLALKSWQDVLSYNTNSQYPYYGMGRAYEMKGDYENAMKYFKLANAKAEYSKSFKEYRKQYANDNIGWIALIIIAVIALIVVGVRVMKKKMVAKHGSAYSPLETRGGLPVYVLMHPVDGFEQFRTRGLHSIPIAIGLVVAWFLVKVLEFFCTGFAFNSNRSIDYDLLANLFATVGLYILFIIANWAICTLSNGKGRMKDIICVTAYSLTPMLLTILLKVVLTNVMTLDEMAFISIIGTVGVLWSAIILLLGLYTIHQYSFGGTIGSVFLTVLGMAVIALLVLLFFTLLQQCFSFISSIISEIKLR